MTDVTLPSGPIRTTRWAARAGIAAGVLALLGTWGTGFGLWAFPVGFLFVGVAVLLSAIALALGLYALIKRRGGRVPRGGLWLGLLAAVAVLGWLGSWLSAGSSAPMIHDITTDTVNPPAFTKLTLRKDNLVGLRSVDEWRQIHNKAYSDIKPLSLTEDPATVIANAEALVKARGWDVVLVAADRIEATDTVSVFRFKDDIVIIAVPGAEGKGSVVNIRSVSRVGQGDLGVNANRVRRLLADLAGAAR